jgi:hypothetical protein
MSSNEDSEVFETPFDEVFDEPKIKKTVVAKSKKVKAKEAELERIEQRALGHKAPTPEVSVNGDTNGNITSQDGFFDGGPKVTKSYVEEMARREEIEADLIRQNGRYIESVDNARPGVPFASPSANAFDVTPYTFVDPPKRKYRADGVDFSGDILDTGEGAQRPTPMLYARNEDDPDGPDIKLDSNDPRSTDFITCGNGNCPYREHCLRYRMKDVRRKNGKVDNAFLFFPEECRRDGIYIDIQDHPNYHGYGVFEAYAISGTPDLGSPMT